MFWMFLLCSCAFKEMRERLKKYGDIDGPLEVAFARNVYLGNVKPLVNAERGGYYSIFDAFLGKKEAANVLQIDPLMRGMEAKEFDLCNAFLRDVYKNLQNGKVDVHFIGYVLKHFHYFLKRHLDEDYQVDEMFADEKCMMDMMAIDIKLYEKVMDKIFKDYIINGLFNFYIKKLLMGNVLINVPDDVNIAKCADNVHLYKVVLKKSLKLLNGKVEEEREKYKQKCNQMKRIRILNINLGKQNGAYYIPLLKEVEDAGANQQFEDYEEDAEGMEDDGVVALAIPRPAIEPPVEEQPQPVEQQPQPVEQQPQPVQPAVQPRQAEQPQPIQPAVQPQPVQPRQVEPRQVEQPQPAQPVQQVQPAVQPAQAQA